MSHEADQIGAPADSEKSSDSLWERLDRRVKTTAENADEIAIALTMIGLMLAVASFLIDVMLVTFDGELKGSATIGVPNGFTEIKPKQVGFLAAPNWLLTGFLFLPYAVWQALRARSAIEPVIEALIENRMLVTRTFEAPNREEILAAWRKRSRRMMPVVSFVALVVFALVVFDFITVVAQWTLASESGLADLADGVTLHHKDYEFDWSVAAAFGATEINPWVNVIFAGLAYLFIAALGACFLFAAFIYFFGAFGFFSRANLGNLNLILVPNPKSTDPRCGFEVFEDFFDPFVLAAVATAVIALAMHLQNIYLRAPTQPDIFVMVLGPTQGIIENLRENPQDISFSVLSNLGLFHDIKVLSGFKLSITSLQVFASAIALLLIAVIVFGYVYGILRSSARSGVVALKARVDLPVNGVVYTDVERTKIGKIDVWPIGWISLNFLLICILVAIISLWWPRLIALIFALFIIRTLTKLIQR